MLAHLDRLDPRISEKILAGLSLQGCRKYKARFRLQIGRKPHIGSVRTERFLYISKFLVARQRFLPYLSNGNNPMPCTDKDPVRYPSTIKQSLH